MGKPQRRPASPRIPAALESVSGQKLADESNITDSDLSGDLSFSSGWRVSIQRTRMSAVHLTGSVLNGLSLIDVLVEQSDLSGVDLDESSFTRVEFRDCRMDGAGFTRSRFRDVLFTRCRLNQASFRMSDAPSTWFDETEVREGDFYAAQMEGSRFFDCVLDGAELSKASLAGARFHGSSLIDLKGSDSLSGAVIDSLQVLAVAQSVLSALGVTVDDERDPSDSPKRKGR